MSSPTGPTEHRGRAASSILKRSWSVMSPRDERVLSLEDAVRKMTSLPAQRLGRLDRGLIRHGCAADLVVFDPERVIDRATFEDPHQFCDGVTYVVVNGQLVIEDGIDTGSKAGRVLRPTPLA